ncbi:hypothetical protein GCM10009801_79710 [Streptomyces albiaxialis]|uniref:Uncharacterized protein n=1 Tax=Streptomyces albiaxialis TaxID=329523 RepID=A0ABN2X3A7_9ACTN
MDGAASRFAPGAWVLPTFTAGIFAFSPPLPQAEDGFSSSGPAIAGVTDAPNAKAATIAIAARLARLGARLTGAPNVRICIFFPPRKNHTMTTMATERPHIPLKANEWQSGTHSQ